MLLLLQKTERKIHRQILGKCKFYTLNIVLDDSATGSSFWSLFDCHLLVAVFKKYKLKIFEKHKRKIYLYFLKFSYSGEFLMNFTNISFSNT